MVLVDCILRENVGKMPWESWESPHFYGAFEWEKNINGGTTICRV